MLAPTPPPIVGAPSLGESWIRPWAHGLIGTLANHANKNTQNIVMLIELYLLDIDLIGRNKIYFSVLIKLWII